MTRFPLGSYRGPVHDFACSTWKPRGAEWALFNVDHKIVFWSEDDSSCALWHRDGRKLAVGTLDECKQFMRSNG